MEFFGNVLDWVIALFLFGLLMFIHELGHFVAARLARVKVEEFGFGFPPRAVKLFTWQGTLFSLNAIPFGAFVRPAGEDDPKIEGGLAAASKRARTLVLLGGVALNALAAVAAYTIAFKVAFPVGALVDDIAPDSPAARAGLQVGDVVVAADGGTVKSRVDLINYIYSHLGATVGLQVMRGGEPVDVRVTTRTQEEIPEGQGPTGLTVGDALSGSENWGQAFLEALTTIRDQLRMILQLPSQILRGGFNAATDRPVGPIGILDVTNQLVGSVRQSNRWVYLLQWMGGINLALAFGNLLPIPALDGGRLVFVALEALRGRRVDPEKERMVHAYSMLVLLALMTFITFLDLFFPVLPR
jgi:regulator of sigma E protease